MFTVNALIVLGIATLASGVSAISKSCSEALGKIAVTDAGQCLNLKGLIPLATLNPNASLVTPIDGWLQGLCYNGPSCSNDTLSKLGTSLNSSCGQDIEAAGVPKIIVQNLPELIVQYYPPIIDALCVRNTSDATPNEDFCTTYELNLLQAGIHQNLTTHNLIPSIVDGFAGNTNLTKSLVCTKCAEGAYAVVRPQLNNDTQQLLDGYFSGYCGSSFQATSTPAGIIEATGSLATQSFSPTSSKASPTKKGAAAASFVHPSISTSMLTAFVGMAGACLVGMGGVFTGGF